MTEKIISEKSVCIVTPTVAPTCVSTPTPVQTPSILIKNRLGITFDDALSSLKRNSFAKDTTKAPVSKSWNGYYQGSFINNSITKPTSLGSYDRNSFFKQKFGDTNKQNNILNNICQIDTDQYDAITHCKSAGIIPYTIKNGTVYFMFQTAVNPLRKKDDGLNDFGGKRNNNNETTAETAAREFSEETSCLFYLAEQKDPKSVLAYHALKDNSTLFYDESIVSTLKNLIPLSQKYFSDKITEFVLPIFVSSKETYISYFVKVAYIDEKDLPRAEDIHIDYKNRYIRTCRWYSYNEVMAFSKKDFHKRLQITKIQQRILSYSEKGLFT